MTNRKRLLVSQNVSGAGWALLENRPDIVAVPFDTNMPLEAYRDLLPGAHGVVLYSKPFGAAELARADAMLVVARMGVGFDAVDLRGCTARGILVMTTGTANSASVAESALAMMLELTRRNAEFDRMVREGRWDQRGVALPVDLCGRTVLIVGFGRIGSRMAARCRAFEMTVLVHDPYVDPAGIVAAGCQPVTLAEGLPRADVLSVHCPRNAETMSMIDARRLARLRSGALVINTARGGIVDEAALHDALVSGHLGGAGLDVFVQEPVPTDHPLLHLPNVVVAPHVAGGTVEAIERVSRTAVANALSVFDGRPDRANVVNREALP